MILIPGLVSVTFRKKTANEIISLCKKVGFKGVEWGENAHVFPGDTKSSSELASICAGEGLQIAAYGSYYRLGQNMDFLPTLDSAEALGAPLIRIWAGNIPSSEVDEKLFDELAEEASKISDLAAVRGIKVAMEWHKNSLTDTNESACKFLTRVNNSNLYCLWQPTQALGIPERCAGLSFLAKPDAVPFGVRLLNLHAYYWDAQGRRPLKEGINDWNQYLSCLSENKGERFILLEFVKDDSEEQFFEDATVLKEICDSYNKNNR